MKTSVDESWQRRRDSGANSFLNIYSNCFETFIYIIDKLYEVIIPPSYWLCARWMREVNDGYLSTHFIYWEHTLIVQAKAASAHISRLTKHIEFSARIELNFIWFFFFGNQRRKHKSWICSKQRRREWKKGRRMKSAQIFFLNQMKSEKKLQIQFSF